MPSSSSPKGLVPGYAVALVLKAGTAPHRCYVGRVQAVDQQGVRITLIDWLEGQFTGWDFLAPWESITSAMIATPDQDIQSFVVEAAEFQKKCEHIEGGTHSIR
jgi:hypothetical protein